jgi:putative acetyltransferase
MKHGPRDLAHSAASGSAVLCSGVFQIITATTPEHFAMFRELCREYAASLTFSLEFQGFEHEMATLPGKYGPPSGAIVLAVSDGTAIGCVALRELQPRGTPGEPRGVCEMKRMYLKPECRGQGVGAALGEAIVAHARRLGYARMLLDTDQAFHAAIAVYTKLGFVPIERYNDDMHPDTRFFGLDLAARND